MTRPMSEDSPGKQAANYGYRIRQLERRPAPEVGEPVESVHLYAWNYDSTNVATADAWTPVANFAGGGGFFEEIWYSKPAGEDTFNATFNDGLISNANISLYQLMGWVQFNEDSAAGDQVIVGINFGSSDRYLNEYTWQTDSLAESQEKMVVVCPRLSALSSVFLEVWHNSTGTRTIRDAQFQAHKFGLLADGHTEVRP